MGRETGHHDDAHRPILWFDGRCGFCTRWADWLASRCEADVRPWQSGGFGRNGLRRSQVKEAAWWVARDGTTHGAHLAIGRALEACGGVVSWLGRLMLLGPFRRLAAFGYRVIADNRARLPGKIPACDTGRC